MPKRVRKRILSEDEVADAAATGKRSESQCDAEQRIINKYKDKVKSPITAIRAHCVECLGGAVREVAECTAPGCSLYPFRMGTNVMDSRSIEAQKKRG